MRGPTLYQYQISDEFKGSNPVKRSVSGLNRRHFLGMATMGAGAALFPDNTYANKDSGILQNKELGFTEPAKNIPIKGDFDVIVCGGGPAGIAAAVSAARTGARTLLIESGGCLGGVWTSGLLTFIFDFDKPGLTHEIKEKLNQLHAKRNKPLDNFVYSPEPMKLLLENMCTEAGVEFQLHTRVTAAYLNNKRLSTIVTESKSGREAWSAKVFIDATGDGDVGAFAGNGWDIGQGGDTCPCQPMTLNALSVVKDVEKLKEYLSFYDPEQTEMSGHVKASQAFKKEIARAGITPSYGDPTLFPIKDNLVMLMVNHEYNIRAIDASEITKATVRARAEIHKIALGLNDLGGDWEGFQLVATADQIGIRDGRRLHGRFTVTKEDLVNGSRYPDAVTRPHFGVDIHANTKEINDKQTISRGGIVMKPYDIPLRALIAKDVDALIMAGRCISGDFIAHASYRVTGNSVAMGEAAGAVAAIASKSNRLPHEVEWKEAQKVLIDRQ